MRNALTVLILSLVLITSASAEFNAYGDTTIDAKVCETIDNSLFIENIEQYNQTFTISVSGKGADLILFSVLEFEINPGKIAQINTAYDIPCDQELGDYPVTIYFTSGELEKSLAQNIVVRSKDTINLSSSQTASTIGACGTAKFNAILQNPEDIQESYDISVSGHPDARTEPEYIFLGPGQQENITITIDVQDCRKTGQYDITLEAQAHEAQTQKTLEFTLDVENRNIPSMMPSAEMIRTGYETSTAKIPIKNTGNKETTYQLSVTGIEWAKATPATLTLQPREEQETTITFTPDESIATGKYPFSLSVLVQDTQIEYTVGLTARLQPPTYFEKHRGFGLGLGVLIILLLAGVFAWLTYINKPKVKARRQKKKEKKAEKKQKKKERKLLARQKKKETKLRKADQKKSKKETKPKTVKADIQAKKTKSERRLEKERAKLQKQLEKEYRSKYLLVDKDKLQHGSKTKAKGLLYIIFAAILLFIGLFWNTILQAWKHALAALAVLAAIFILRAIGRSKKITKKYRLFLKTPKHLRLWRKGPVSLAIEPEAETKNAEITIKKTKPQSKSGIHHSTFILEDNINKAKYACSFRVSKKWFKRKEVPRDNLRLGKLSKGRWRTVPLEQTGEDKKYVYYTANIRQGTYSLHGKPEYSKSKKKPLIAIIGSLAAIITLIIVLVPVDMQEQENTAGIPPQNWKQDTEHRIDLNPYFNDPDQDKLIFAATPLQNIIVTFDNGIAILTPKEGWTGMENVKFIADDGSNATVESNTVKLTVSKRLIPKNAPVYFAIALAIAALLILFLGLKDLKKRI